MKIAIINNGIIENIGEHYELFPNVSFPVTGVTSEFLTENSAVEVISYIEADFSIFNLVDEIPYLLDGKVYTVKLIPKTEEELAAEIALKQQITANTIRTERNIKLQESDWTQVADAPVDKTAWAAYRQSLRDITSQEGFPFNVIFPTPPL